MTMLKDMKPVPLSFKVESANQANIYHHGFGSNRELHSVTVLKMDPPEDNQDIQIDISADAADLKSY